MELRNFLDKADAPVLIDQEGGRVVRLDRRISRSIRPARPSATPRWARRPRGWARACGRGRRVYSRVRIQNESTQIAEHRRAGVADCKRTVRRGRKRTAGWRLCVNMARTACYHFATKLPDTYLFQSIPTETVDARNPYKLGLTCIN